MSVRRVQVRDSRHVEHDVFIDAEPTTPVATLIDELDAAGFSERPIGLDGTDITAATAVGELELVHGSLLTSGDLVPRPPRPSVGMHLVVVCGPDAGAYVTLPQSGTVIIGRSSMAQLTIADPLLSSQHCRVEVADGQATIVDLGSTNGTMVEGTWITEPAVLGPHTYFQIGSTVMAVVTVAPTDVAAVGPPNGPDRVFSRRYRTAQTSLPDRVEPPRREQTTTSTLSSVLLRALLPVVTGVAMAVIMKRWEFLLIVVISPIVLGIEGFKRKRSQDREAGKADATYKKELAEFRANVDALRNTERDRARSVSHCGGLALLMSAVWHRRLWERAPTDEDFCSVPVGLGALTSSIQADDPDDALDDVLWGSPLETNLVSTGSLAIVGDTVRARATARGLVMNLMATHSPADVKLWIITDDVEGRHWGFARWLPHTFMGLQASSIAVDGDTRAELLKHLKQVLDTRSENDTSSGRRQHVPLPVHVVVVDGPDLVDSMELADLLRRGPAVGVVGITVDQRLAPEGTGATLALSGDADRAEFDSRHHPHVAGVIVPEIDVRAAERSARRLAPLRPSVDGDRGGIGGVCHLVEIESLTGLTPDQLAQRWSGMSPHMVATVGKASETTMYVDLIKDGPHGLVGGTSGSGKTEFLKTLFVSLCLNNHPDDLAIVVVDFKGGVDHDAIRPLPHVVDVATNLDIDQFHRTIAMLNAEQKRRQALLSRAGANNLVSYRAARVSKPELPPLPRLLVVVDEFGELLASEGGRDQLKELESVTRIGRALGLHLLLVTQSFEGNLPGQIDANAGLRISLRVQKPEHSKAVLDSGIAATISDKHIGRAYARFHGRDLIEFQTARVAGRRRDLEPDEAGADVRLVPFASLALPPPVRRSEDVPDEETDMYVLVERCRQAATLTGWTRSAVPWPAALPDDVSVYALASHAPATVDAEGGHDLGVPIGLVDVPDEQRREIGYVAERVQQLAVVGGSDAPIPEILTTYGVTLGLHRSPDDAHVYGIDLLGRSLAQLTDLPHCGGVAVRNEQLALRILRWMLQVAAERKMEIARTGSSTIWEHAASGGEMPPQIVLLVSGVDRLLQSDDATNQTLLGPLSTLIAEGLGVRMQVVLGGSSRIVNHRLGSNIGHRLVLHIPDATEYAAVGASKDVAGDLRTLRRAVLLPDRRIIQLAQLAPKGSGDGQAIARFAASLPPASRHRPHRFVDVPWPLAWETASQLPLEPTSPHFVAPLPVAIDTGTGGWSWIDAIEDGPAFAVAGPPKSGRSTALAVLARLAASRGWRVVNATASRRSPLATSRDPLFADRIDPGELGELAHWVDTCDDAATNGTGHVLVIIDDLHRVDDGEGIEALLGLPGGVLLAVAGSPELLSSFGGVMRSLSGQVNSGILLAPKSPMDGDAIGVRRLPPEWTSDPRPGRGILAVAGEPNEIQVPLVALDG